MKRGLIALIVIAAAIAIVARNTSGFVVKAGNVGLVINHLNGRVDPRIRSAGFNVQPPFSMNELIEIPTYERTYTMVADPEETTRSGSDDSVLVNTLSSNTLKVDTSVTYHIAYEKDHPDRIVDLYQKYRTQFTDFGSFEEAQLRPAFRQAIVDAFGAQTTSVSMTGDGKRKAAEYAVKELNDRFNGDSIIVDEVRIRAIYPDGATVTALRSRLQAQQNLKLAQLNQQLQQLINQKAVLAAQAEAQSAQIRAASLTPRLVKYKHIQDIDIVGVPRGAIVNVPSDEQAEPAQQEQTAGQEQTGQQ